MWIIDKILENTQIISSINVSKAMKENNMKRNEESYKLQRNRNPELFFGSDEIIYTTAEDNVEISSYIKKEFLKNFTEEYWKEFIEMNSFLLKIDLSMFGGHVFAGTEDFSSIFSNSKVVIEKKCKEAERMFKKYDSIIKEKGFIILDKRYLPINIVLGGKYIVTSFGLQLVFPFPKSKTKHVFSFKKGNKVYDLFDFKRLFTKDLQHK